MFLFWRKKAEPPTASPEEPLFVRVHDQDEEMMHAHARASASLDQFVTHLQRPGGHICAAKLRLNDPESSERLGEQRFVNLWLAPIQQDSLGNVFRGQFLKSPKSWPNGIEWAKSDSSHETTLSIGLLTMLASCMARLRCA